MRTGENGNQHFLLFSLCFQMVSFSGLFKVKIVLNLGKLLVGWLVGCIQVSPFPKQTLVFTCLQYKSFENTVGKEEIARDEQFFLFSAVFSLLSLNFLAFSSNLKLSSANSFGLEV